jgi:uncharacterized protein YndB with AHSA1/START domain
MKMSVTEKKYEVVFKEITVKASQARTFRAFTEQMGQWWPKSHHIGQAEMKDVILEPKEGGRWYEVGVDDSECDWGKVLSWKPQFRVVLAWQLNAEWKYDPSLITEVEINFVEQGPQLTRFTLEHRNLEKFGIKAQEIWTAFDSDEGWGGLLRLVAGVAES